MDLLFFKTPKCSRRELQDQILYNDILRKSQHEAITCIFNLLKTLEIILLGWHLIFELHIMLYNLLLIIQLKVLVGTNIGGQFLHITFKYI